MTSKKGSAVHQAAQARLPSLEVAQIGSPSCLPRVCFSPRDWQSSPYEKFGVRSPPRAPGHVPHLFPMDHGCRMLKCASTDHRKHETRPKRAAAAPTIDNLHARTLCPARQLGSGSLCGNRKAKAIFPPRAAQTSGQKCCAGNYGDCRLSMCLFWRRPRPNS